MDLAAGVSVEEIVSPSHAIRTRSISSYRATVDLGPADRIPNKDFVLRYRVAGDRVKSALLTHRDRTGDYFTLMLFPPRDLSTLPRMPAEMIFVLDCSGSMRGEPLAKSKAAIERVLRRLEPADTFQVINFSNSAAQLGASPLPATPENVRRGLDYVRNLRSEGGTMMIAGVRAALDFPHDPHRLRVVSFLTDGFIGNEDEVFAEIHRGLGSARIFSFGIGSSVNRHLIEGMARIGRGAVAYVGLDESAGSQVDLFYDRVGRPAMTDIAVDWGGMRVSDVYPRRIPDLFVGRPVILTGRFEGRGTTTLRISGRAGGALAESRLNADLESSADAHPGIPFVWARKQIEVLEDQMTRNPSPALAAEVRDLALRHGLVSTYTAYVAVDATRVTAGDHGTTVPVGVPVPEGVKYETTVK